ncbi:hypothetical protein BAL199_12316 [alpha proteobacterium BAL199]|nr:hypothetical protein BAL199_12316 [alpha proteobacterium BAL199]
MRRTEAPSDRTPIPSVARKLTLARAIVDWERLWPSLWPALMMLAIFFGIALLGLPSAIGSLTGGWGQLALLVGFAAAFLWIVRRGVVAWQPANDADAARRLEHDSALAHRPVSSQTDRPAGADRDPVAQALWTAHRQRQEASLSGLRVAAPEPVMARLDRFGTRSLAGLVLIAGVAVAAPDPLGRMAEAFHVTLTPLVETPAPTFDVWINPPAYTGRPPMMLARAGQPVAGVAGKPNGHDPRSSANTPKRLAVPTGSVLLAKVNGGTGAPLLAFATRGGETVKPFEKVAEQAHQIETPITEGTALSIRQNRTELAAWTITVLPDLQPTVAFAEPPQATERAALMIHYTASDDYGLTAVEARIRLLNPEGKPTADDPLVLSLALPGNGLEAADAKDYHDLTPHPWAGQTVDISLLARDEAGQEGVSEPVRMILPERQFQHPVARAIIEQRKRLLTEPHEKTDIAEVLMSLAARPQHYYDDIVTFLSLRVAAGRLVISESSIELIANVQSLLWDTALRIEDGEMSLAARELRELERRLMEMLAQDNPDQQALEQLMEELKQAIDKYLKAMMEQMQQQLQLGDPQQAQDIDPRQMIERKDLMDMVDRARELMKSGAKDAARQLLSQLREMMENLRAGRPQPMSPEQQAAQEMMRQLQELAEQQQRLMDDTYKAHQEGFQREGRDQQMGQMPGQPREHRPGQRSGQQGQAGDGTPQGADRSGRQSRPDQGQITPEALAQMQERLRRQLGDFMRKLGEGLGQIPQPFGEAERAMKDAADALGRAQPGDAVGPQGDAVERLQDGAQALAEAMRQNQQANGGAAPDPNAQGLNHDDQRRDPLRDRPNSQGYANDNGGIEIPGESDLLRARRIFDELRRRSGDRQRPETELNYIERLLKRF